jgi:nucleoside-diphosphate-sugar epimerase
MRLDLLVNHFVHAAVTDGYLVLFEGHFKRNYVHIGDVADCFCFCLDAAATMRGGTFNLGLDSANLTKCELARKVQEYVPRLAIHSSEFGTDPDKRNYIVSSRKLRDAGFSATRSLDLGITQLLRAYRMMGRGHYFNA